MKHRIIKGSLAAIAGVAALAPIVPATAIPSAGVVVNEVRTRGPVGGNDEFIELRNAGPVAVDITGWKVNGCAASGTVSTRITIGSESGATVVLDPGESYLLTNDNASLTSPGYESQVVTGGRVPGNESYGVGISDEGGVSLVNGSTVVDSIGFSATTCFEGAPAAAKDASANDESAATRTELAAGFTLDRDRNDLDFTLQASTAARWDG